MAQKKEKGVFQLKDGSWGFRFSIIVDGQTISRKRVTDDLGGKFKTQKQAAKARAAAMEQARTERQRQRTISRRKVKEVFEEYCTTGRTDRAYQTIRKQDSIWRIHLQDRFGNRFVDDIPVAEINDYLAELYYKDGLAYRYVESFLKMFYLIFGQAYSRNYLDVDTYNKLCINKDTKIHMPKLKDEDDTDIVAFNRDELVLLDDYFEGTNAETAYLLGRFCGLRINECYGLKWDHVDLEAGTIYIDRQMQYQNGFIKLVPVKTRNGKRTVYLCDKLKVYFQKLAAAREQAQKDMAMVREQRKTIIEDLDGSPLSSLELVNSLMDGKIQTVNSMKYHSRMVKETLKIDFKFHYLRHTYGTMMAELNTPQHLLCSQMGHGNINVTQRYYLAVTKTGVDVLKDKINQL